MIAAIVVDQVVIFMINALVLTRSIVVLWGFPQGFSTLVFCFIFALVFVAHSFRQLIVLLGRVLNSPRGGEIWCFHVGTFKGMREDHQWLMQQRSKNCSSECEPDRFGEAREMRFIQPSKAALICPPNFPAHGFVYVGIK